MAFEEPAVGVVVIVCVRIEPLRVTTWTLVIGVPAILEEAGLEEDSVGATAEEVDAGVEVEGIYKELSSVTVVSTTTGLTVVFVPGVEEGEGEGVEVEDIRPAELVCSTKS
jgi:hypothetical protein